MDILRTIESYRRFLCHLNKSKDEEAKILVIFPYLLLLILEETFDHNILLLSNILKAIYIIMAFKYQLNKHYLFILQITLIIAINYYSNQSKSDNSLILLILFTNMTSNSNDKPKSKRLNIFIIHSVFFTIILSIFSYIYTQRESSFFSFKIFSHLSEVEIVLSFFFINNKEKEVNSFIKEAKIGFAILKHNTINNPSDGVTVFFANSIANEVLIKAEMKESNKEKERESMNTKANKLSLINQIRGDIVINKRIIDKTYVSNDDQYSVNAITSPSCTLMTIEKTIFDQQNIKQKIFADQKLQILISFLHNLNNPINGLLVYSQKCLELLSEYHQQLIPSDLQKNQQKQEFKSIVDNIKYNRYYIKIFNKNITFFSKLLLDDENIHPSFADMSLINIIKKEVERYEVLYLTRSSKLEYEIKVPSNITICSDYKKFKFLLKNIFLLILRKRQYETATFTVEFSDESQTKVRLMLKMNNTRQSTIDKDKDKENQHNEIYKLEQNIQTMEMLVELINRLSKCLRIPIHIDNDSISFECDCKIGLIKEEETELNMFEFSPKTDSQNKNRRLLLNRSLPYPNKHSQPVSTKQSKLNIDLAYCEEDPSPFTLNDEDKFYEGSISIDNEGIKSGFKDKDNILLFDQSTKQTSTIDSHFDYNTTHNSNNGTNGNSTHCQFILDKQTKASSHYSLTPVIQKSEGLINNHYINTKQSSLRNTSKEQIGKCNCNQVLIIDDEEFIVKSIKSIIYKEFKVNSDECTNGIEAMKKIKHNITKNCCLIKYKLLFVDINMPLMGGYSVCNEIQKLFPEGFDLSIIIISSYSNISYVQSILKKNPFVKDFSKKPVKKSAIIKFYNQYFIKSNCIESDIYNQIN